MPKMEVIEIQGKRCRINLSTTIEPPYSNEASGIGNLSTESETAREERFQKGCIQNICNGNVECGSCVFCFLHGDTDGRNVGHSLP